MSTSVTTGTFLGHIPGPINAEDITRIPDTPWVITTGMKGPTVPYGRLYAIDVRDHSAQEIFPYQFESNYDENLYGEAPTLDPATFEPHGIDVYPGEGGVHTLHVINHGGREAVEVFECDMNGPRPRLTWVGTVVVPTGNWPNDVASLEGGGFVVSSTLNPDGEDGMAGGMMRMLGGEKLLGAYEWRPGQGWNAVEGSMMAGANGIAATADGSVVFIGGWAEKNLTRIDRRGGEAKVDVVPVEIFTDNLTWTSDRSAVVAAGSYGIEVADIFHCFKSDNMICAHPSQVVRMDAESLAVDVVVAYDSDTMGSGTTGLEVDGEMWVSSVRDSGVNRFEPGA